MLRRLLGFLHTFCNHPSKMVVGDLKAGEDLDHPILWCRVCGGRGEWELARDICAPFFLPG